MQAAVDDSNLGLATDVVVMSQKKASHGRARYHAVVASGLWMCVLCAVCVLCVCRRADATGREAEIHSLHGAF